MSDIDLSHLHTAIYCRKSQESEERQVLSLPAQRDEAAAIAARLGISRIETYEEAKSAKTSGRRNQFDRMIRDIRKGKINAIICWKLDRLARNMIEGGLIIDLLQSKKLQAIITPGKIYYPNENALLMSVEFGAANQYSRDLSQNVTRGLIKKARNGYPPGRACIGFANALHPVTRERIWLEDKQRFPIVKKMFEMYLSKNYSGGKVHEWAVNVAKLTTPSYRRCGNKPMQQSSIYRMLQNPIYAGYFYVQGERYELHKALPRAISLDEHYRILQMLGIMKVSKVQKHSVIFSGYIHSPSAEWVGADVSFQLRCDCGYKFAYRNKQACPKCGLRYAEMLKPKYLQYTYYRNVAKVKRKEPVKYISEAEVIDAFLRYIEAHLVLSDSFVEWCKNYIREIQDERIAIAVSIKENNEIRKTALITRRARYRELLADGLISKDEYMADVDQIDREMAMFKDNIDDIDIVDKISDALTIGSRMVKTFKTCDLEGKRTLLSQLGSYLVWNEKELKIINTPVMQCIIDGLKKAKAQNPLFVPKNIIAVQDESGVFRSVIPTLCGMLGDVRNILEHTQPPSTDQNNTRYCVQKQGRTI
jgi:DNA invertase Pin-like site-specific DNA recombinase